MQNRGELVHCKACAYSQGTEDIMINIAICDDDTKFCADLTDFFIKNFFEELHLINDYSNGKELISDIQETGIIYDFIFLDLDMPKMDGVTTGYELRKLPTHLNSTIMFITSFDTNPAPIVDIHPFAYIKKPLDYNSFHTKFREALQLFYDEDKLITVCTKKNNLRLDVKKIRYIESFHRNSIIHMINEKLELTISLSELEKIILTESHLFVRIHASYIINMRYLSKVSANEIFLDERISLPISRKYKEDFFLKYKKIFVH